MIPPLVIDLAFDRSLVRDDSLTTFHANLIDLAPEWSAGLVLDPDSAATPVSANSAEFRDAVLSAGAPGPTYHTVVADVIRAGLEVRERIGASVELVGATRSLWVGIDVDDLPFARLTRAQDRLLLGNRIAVEVRTRWLEGRSDVDWAWRAFAALAGALRPAWGALYDAAQYQHLVMQTKPRVEAVGRDFSRFLPGLFAGNFFGPRYVDLVGREQLLSAPADDVAATGGGVLVHVLDDPRDWSSPQGALQAQRVLDHIGATIFFDKTAHHPTYRAPEWP